MAAKDLSWSSAHSKQGLRASQAQPRTRSWEVHKASVPVELVTSQRRKDKEQVHKPTEVLFVIEATKNEVKEDWEGQRGTSPSDLVTWEDPSGEGTAEL